MIILDLFSIAVIYYTYIFRYLKFLFPNVIKLPYNCVLGVSAQTVESERRMFSEAYTNLDRALRQASNTKPNFQNIRSLLKSAVGAVNSDLKQPHNLRQQAKNLIERAISYTYSRTNPAFVPQTFASMSTVPISPFQRNTMGPYGFVKGPMVRSVPQRVPKLWTGTSREAQSLIVMIRAALNVVLKGL